MDASADIGPIPDPSLAAGINLDRAVVIPARDMQVNDRDLQDAAIQVTDLSLFRVPGIFQGLVRFEIFPRIEQAQIPPLPADEEALQIWQGSLVPFSQSFVVIGRVFVIIAVMVKFTLDHAFLTSKINAWFSAGHPGAGGLTVLAISLNQFHFARRQRFVQEESAQFQSSADGDGTALAGSPALEASAPVEHAGSYGGLDRTSLSPEGRKRLLLCCHPVRVYVLGNLFFTEELRRSNF